MAIDLVCEAAVSRGRLKHSWLENQVLNKSVADIVEMRDEGIWDALEVQFPRRIRETLSLADCLLDGFSPAQIVDNLACFAQLAQETRTMLRTAIHTAYLRNCEFSMRSKSIARDATALSDSLQLVRDLWSRGSDSDLRNAWRHALDAAANLRDELDTLPKGIVLP